MKKVLYTRMCHSKQRQVDRGKTDFDDILQEQNRSNEDRDRWIQVIEEAKVLHKLQKR